MNTNVLLCLSTISFEHYTILIVARISWYFYYLYHFMATDQKDKIPSSTTKVTVLECQLNLLNKHKQGYIYDDKYACR